MTENTRPPGKTTIDPSVLLTIARLTTLEVEGVSRLSDVPGGVNRVFKRHQAQGVRIEIEDVVVDVDLYVIVENDVNLRAVSKEVQAEVSRAITEMVGMEVGRINVHIEDIDFPIEAEEE
jgi:uncharacterized alkaline shock family protein YloU